MEIHKELIEKQHVTIKNLCKNLNYSVVMDLTTITTVQKNYYNVVL